MCSNILLKTRLCSRLLSTRSSCSSVYRISGLHTSSVLSGSWFSNGLKPHTRKFPPSVLHKFEYDWDHKLEEKISPDQYLLGVEELEGFEDADEAVKKLFTNKYATQSDVHWCDLTATFKRLGVHPTDRTNIGCIIKYTMVIRKLKSLINQSHQHKNSIMKQALCALISKRKAHLNYLREAKYDTFEWICRELEINYQHQDPFFFKPTRKALRKKEVREECYKARLDRLAKYNSDLENKRAAFIKEKEEALSQLASSLSSLDLDLKTVFKEVVEERKQEVMTDIHDDQTSWFREEIRLKEHYAKIRAEKEERRMKLKRK